MVPDAAAETTTVAQYLSTIDLAELVVSFRHGDWRDTFRFRIDLWDGDRRRAFASRDCLVRGVDGPFHAQMCVVAQSVWAQSSIGRTMSGSGGVLGRAQRPASHRGPGGREMGVDGVCMRRHNT